MGPLVADSCIKKSAEGLLWPGSLTCGGFGAFLVSKIGRLGLERWPHSEQGSKAGFLWLGSLPTLTHQGWVSFSIDSWFPGEPL